MKPVEIGALWKSIKEWHSRRLIVGIFSLTKDDHKKIFDEEFAKAKSLSDFVGMILRLVFVTVAMRFFLFRVGEEQGQWKAWMYGLASVFSVGLLLVFGARIFSVIFLYETRDLSVHTNKIIKIAIFILTLITITSIWIATNELVAVLAKSSIGQK